MKKENRPFCTRIGQGLTPVIYWQDPSHPGSISVYDQQNSSWVVRCDGGDYALAGPKHTTACNFTWLTNFFHFTPR